LRVAVRSSRRYKENPVKQLLDRETAIAEIKGWAEQLGEPLEDEEIINSSVFRATSQGRITFDAERETFTYRLMKPIQLENGEDIETITVEEPTAEYRFAKQTMRLHSTSQSGGTAEMDIGEDGRYLSATTHQSINMLKRLKNRDYVVLSELAGFFG